jgi:hypothetical protein
MGKNDVHRKRIIIDGEEWQKRLDQLVRIQRELFGSTSMRSPGLGAPVERSEGEKGDQGAAETVVS